MNIDSRSRCESVPSSPYEAPLPGGVGETLRQRLARCVERLEDPSLRPAWVIHEVRKDLKRTRALLNLGSGVLPTRSLEKRCAAAARQLSHLRDADAAGETVARLRSRADARQLEALDGLAAWLARPHAGTDAPRLPRPIATEVADALRGVTAELEGLSFERLDAAALDAGLARSRSATATTFRRVRKKHGLARFHDFRKAAKRELHQRELSGRPLDRMEHATLRKLADVLGELQDLSVLRDFLRKSGRWRGPVRRLVGQTMRELKARAIRLGDGRYPERAS